jgi:RNA polymerase sigma-70 factor (ECF subfamily)
LEGKPPPGAQLEAAPLGPDDGQLVGEAMKGRLEAFDRLVERYQRQATAVAYRLLNNRDDAMEIVQDAFLKAFDKLRSLSEPARFGPWVMRIVSNLALNRRRARMLRKTTSLDAADDGQADRMDPPDDRADGPEAAASAKDVQRLIAEALDELPEMQRQALVLFSVEKMPQKEVASLLGCSVEAVKWHVFTARKKLKERLKDYL